ncbi:hypothetical protein TNCT_154591 [Trichonephila clavata]|uniref:Uncharacterized protein n=1 Tax=Trichonephila clavata TaxID=2740835 RepID=A0A8X6H1J3_TRICU|nr:hypothetical protein TNCT_154591 [Trichonephila clavata]
MGRDLVDFFARKLFESLVDLKISVKILKLCYSKMNAILITTLSHTFLVLIACRGQSLLDFNGNDTFFKDEA